MKRSLATIGAMLAVFAFLAVVPRGNTRAYTINTGFTHPCHEEMTHAAMKTAIARGAIDPAADVPLPADDSWRDVLAYLTEGMTLEQDGDREAFLALSLIVSSRYPDNRGESITNAKSLRKIHRDPEDQDSHFLRSADDDYAEGNLSAIDAGLAHIRSQLEAARSYVALEQGDQLIETPVYIEYYGLVNVTVWAPAFYMGVAAHAVEDSFSHTVRSDDLHTIHHVCNYVDAVSFDYDHDRDGLRHSWAMDRCDEEAAGIAVGATEAAGDFISLFADLEGDLDGAFAGFTHDWMEHREGCDDSNDYCGSKWVEVARADPSLPIWEDYFGCDCSATPGAVTAGGSGPWPLLLPAALAGIALALKTR